MKITIPRDQLITGLSRVIDCAHTNVSSPVLCAVLLEAGSGLSLSTTKLDLSANTSIAADVAKPGSIALPAKRLMQVVKELPDGPVSIEAKGDRATIKSGSATFQMAGFDKSAFPGGRAYVDTNKFECAAAALANMLSLVSYAASTDTQRPVLQGVHIGIKEGTIWTQATNGSRLSRVSKKVDNDGNCSAIIPSGTVAVIQRLLANAISCSVSISERDITFRLTSDGGDTIVSSAVIEAQYPDPSRILPKDKRNILSASREALLETARRVALACDEKVNYITFKTTKNKLTMSVVSPSFGEATEDLDVTYDGPEVTVSINSKFFMEPVAALGGECVEIDFRGELEPSIFYGEEPGFIGISMPVKRL